MVLLEEVRGDVKFLIDYYQQLDQKIDRVARESLERDEALDRKIDLYSSTLVGDMTTLRGDTSALKGDVSTLKGDVSTLTQKMDQGFAAVIHEIRALTERFDAHERAHTS